MILHNSERQQAAICAGAQPKAQQPLRGLLSGADVGGAHDLLIQRNDASADIGRNANASTDRNVCIRRKADHPVLHYAFNNQSGISQRHDTQSCVA